MSPPSTIVLRSVVVGLGLVAAALGLIAAFLSTSGFAAETWLLELAGDRTIYGDQLFSVAVCLAAAAGLLSVAVIGISLMCRAGER